VVQPCDGNKSASDPNSLLPNYKNISLQQQQNGQIHTAKAGPKDSDTEKPINSDIIDGNNAIQNGEHALQPSLTKIRTNGIESQQYHSPAIPPANDAVQSEPGLQFGGREALLPDQSTKLDGTTQRIDYAQNKSATKTVPASKIEPPEIPWSAPPDDLATPSTEISPPSKTDSGLSTKLRRYSTTHILPDILASYEPYDWAPMTKTQSNREAFFDDIVKKEKQKEVRERWRLLVGGISQNKKLKAEYKYIRLKPGQIRLLYLHKGERDDPITCTILRRYVNDPKVKGKFDALSYHWGFDEPSEDIFLYEGSPDLEAFRGSLMVTHLQTSRKHREEAKKPEAEDTFAALSRRLNDFVQSGKSKSWLKVRKNLYHALRSLRRRERDILLWVDAVCIDQDEFSHDARKELEDQVSKMAKIYSAAGNVCVWLGEGNDTSEKGMKFIRSLMDISRLDSYILSPEYRGHWKALRAIMTAKWFSRRWVVQEICLARKATVHMGDEVN
jgi:hypothetical protein